MRTGPFFVGVEARATNQLGKSLGVLSKSRFVAQRDATSSRVTAPNQRCFTRTFTLRQAQMAFLISYEHNCMDCILSHTSRSPHCRWGAARFVIGRRHLAKLESQPAHRTSTCWQVFVAECVLVLTLLAVKGRAEFRGAGQARRGSEGGFSLADRRIDPSRRPPLNHARS